VSKSSVWAADADHIIPVISRGYQSLDSRPLAPESTRWPVKAKVVMNAIYPLTINLALTEKRYARVINAAQH
jgi:hypothetical protein